MEFFYNTWSTTHDHCNRQQQHSTITKKSFLISSLFSLDDSFISKKKYVLYYYERV